LRISSVKAISLRPALQLRCGRPHVGHAIGGNTWTQEKGDSYAVQGGSQRSDDGRPHDLASSDRGTGEAYCLAHHLTIEDEKRQLMVAALRYYDTFVKVDRAWLFAERLLYVDWIEERTLS
jgi:SnoaL-like domain